MKVEDVKTIGVVGAGTMGSGIAQIVAASSFDVILNDISEDALKRGIRIIERSLKKLTEKGKISNEDAQKFSKR